MPLRHSPLALTGALLAFGPASIGAAQARPVAGEKWRMSSSSGVGMPGQTFEMCLPRNTSTAEAEAPPAPEEDSRDKLKSILRGSIGF